MLTAKIFLSCRNISANTPTWAKDEWQALFDDITENHYDAYVFFEALNNRGVPLTLADLLKNQLLAKLSEQVKNLPDSDNIVQNYLNLWNEEIVGKIPKVTRADIERFFHQIYNACRKSWAEKYPALADKLEVAERANLLKMYETIINESGVDC